MAQNVNINFAQGENSKTDPWQLPIGQFLSLENSVFQKGELLGKRPGYGVITASAPASASYLTTLNDNLLVIGDTVSAEINSLEKFVTKGNLQPCSLDVFPIIRNNLNQVQNDTAVSNNLVCIVYTQQTASATGQQNQYLYCIQDVNTQQNIVDPTAIPALSTGTISGSSRVIVVGNFFVIVSPVTISSTSYLQYFSIPISNPSNPSPAQSVCSEAFIPLSSNPNWDIAVSLDTLVVAYNTTAGGQGIHITTLTIAQISTNTASGLIHSLTNANYKASTLSLCVDYFDPNQLCYISFYNPSNTSSYTFSVYIGFGTITTHFNPVLLNNALTLGTIASFAYGGLCSVLQENIGAYSFDATLPFNSVYISVINDTGTLLNNYTLMTGVGLASKAFVVNGVGYVLCAFQSTFQPSYFLINASLSASNHPVIVAKLAYQNGGGYLSLGLPSVSIIGSTAYISYLYKQNVQALNTLNNTQQTTAGGIYSQLGINLVAITLGTENIASAEIAQDLHLSGGYLSMFDGALPVEHNFFIFPENLKCVYTETSTVTPTGYWANASFTITVSSATGIYPGMTIVDTSNSGYIPANTQILYVNGTTLTLNKATTHVVNSGSPDNLSIQGNIAAQPDSATNTNAYYYIGTYEWTDAKGNAFRSAPSIPVAVTTVGSGSAGIVAIHFPYLNITQKVVNLVKLVLYRWSIKTQAYNQVTSITAPVLNDTTANSITIIDTLPDSEVVGNNILYTTGGVVPDTNGPASNLMTTFDTRLVLVDAEDGNLLWISKTVIEGVPVEMSSDFTIYIAPNAGTSQSTGKITAIFPMDDKLILFKKNALYYMNGTGPDNLGTTSPGCPLGNYSPPIFITSVVGCDNPKSIVLTPDGLMFQSDKGIWILDRATLKASYIGAPEEAYNSYKVTSAQVIPETNYVLFTLNTNVILMYDYYFNQWGHWKFPVPILSSCIVNNLHTVLTVDGQIFQQTPDSYLDGSTPVLMQFTTSWINLASLQGYQRFYEMYLLANFLSPHLLQVQVAYDYNASALQSNTITPLNFSPPTPSPFGIPTPVGSLPQVEQWRIHAKQQLCQSFQISIQEFFNPAYGTTPGAGFTMSGINAKVLIKKGMRPIRGANSVG